MLLVSCRASSVDFKMLRREKALVTMTTSTSQVGADGRSEAIGNFSTYDIVVAYDMSMAL